MGVGNVLRRASFMRRPVRSRWRRTSPRRGRSYPRPLHRIRDSWDEQWKRASVVREQYAICIFDCRVDIRRHVSPLRATNLGLIELSVRVARKEGHTWSRAAVSLKTLRHVVQSGCRGLVSRACSRSASALEKVRFQVGSGQRKAGQVSIDGSPLLRPGTDAM